MRCFGCVFAPDRKVSTHFLYRPDLVLTILGNALQLDTKRPWLTYTAWGKTYGLVLGSKC